MLLSLPVLKNLLNKTPLPALNYTIQCHTMGPVVTTVSTVILAAKSISHFLFIQYTFINNVDSTKLK